MYVCTVAVYELALLKIGISGNKGSSKQRDPNPEDNSLIRKDTSTYEGSHSTFAAVLSYYGASVRVRVPLFASHTPCFSAFKL